jgi:hypothetical protein
VNGCARAASALTELVTRLGDARRTLDRHSQMPESDFGGEAGSVFRDGASRTADVLAAAASDIALLAGALARLGRELDAVHELRRTAGSLPPQEAADVRRRVDQRERRAQAAWRSAVTRYDL